MPYRFIRYPSWYFSIQGWSIWPVFVVNMSLAIMKLLWGHTYINWNTTQHDWVQPAEREESSQQKSAPPAFGFCLACRRDARAHTHISPLCLSSVLSWGSRFSSPASGDRQMMMMCFDVVLLNRWGAQHQMVTVFPLLLWIGDKLTTTGESLDI